MPQSSVADRFWAKVEKTDDCWLWTGALSHGRYGAIWDGQRTRGAHRVVWEMLRGPIPEGLVIDHLCRVTRCVNPDHLEVVTQGENLRRADIAGLSQRCKTHCPRGHEYSESNTYRHMGRYRACRACHRATQQRRRDAARG